MNELIEFLTSEEVILVYFIAGLALFICFIVYIVEKNNDRLRKRHNTKELNKLVEQIKEIVPEEKKDVIEDEKPILMPITDAASIDEMLEKTENIKNVEDNISYASYNIEPKLHENTIDEIQYTSIEPDMETAKLELKKLEEQLILEEKNKKEEIVEPVIENEKNIELTAYEKGQEAEAIISLDELLSKGKELYDANEVTQYEDEGNEPISIQDLEKRMDKNKVETISLDKEEKVDEIKQEIKNVGDIRIEPKFKSSPIISPIYGIEKINNDNINDLALENTANYDKLDQEIKKTNEFLMTLKELQNKLE
jgi:hypothetical protein